MRSTSERWRGSDGGRRGCDGPSGRVGGLARESLGERGEVLKAGWIIFSGGLTAPMPLTADNVISAEFDGLGAIEVFAT
jgi:2-oxo-3-hexenedioate decarboxylase